MLGKIEKIDLRDVWKHEAFDFTTWLAKEENIQLLSEEVGIEMQVLDTEANVGTFSADVLAEEINTENKIIIENQLEATNHDHLGKLITYASGLDAKYIIWIFKEMRDEHRSAIDWLNEVTNEKISFFAIKMELWKIGNSLPAPKFNIICSPNDWAKVVKNNSNNQSLTDNNLIQIEFWKNFSEYLSKTKTPFTGGTGRPQPWYSLRIGNSQIHLELTISVQYNFIRTELYIPNSKDLYNKLLNKKEEIEDSFGQSLDWREDMTNARTSRIQYKRENIDIKQKENHDEAYKWLLDNSIKLYNSVKKIIK
jgi:hypothetical protein